MIGCVVKGMAEPSVCLSSCEWTFCATSLWAPPRVRCKRPNDTIGPSSTRSSNQGQLEYSHNKDLTAGLTSCEPSLWNKWVDGFLFIPDLHIGCRAISAPSEPPLWRAKSHSWWEIPTTDRETEQFGAKYQSVEIIHNLGNTWEYTSVACCQVMAYPLLVICAV